MEHIAIIIHWKGPYSYDVIKNNKSGNGLYLFAGKRRWQRYKSQILYCRITKGEFYNRFKIHHKLPDVYRELEIWLGQLIHPLVPTRNHLEIAESLLVYFWQPELNERKRMYPPRQAISLISHWFKKDGTPRKNQRRIYSQLPDVICWDNSLWRTGNLHVQPF